MNKLLVFMFVAIVFILSLREGIGYASFKFNQNDIANELCEQKAIDENLCQGTCYFSKQFKKEQEKKDTPLDRNQEEQSIKLFCSATLAIEYITHLLKKSHSIFRGSLLNGYRNELYRPPCALA